MSSFETSQLEVESGETAIMNIKVTAAEGTPAGTTVVFDGAKVLATVALVDGRTDLAIRRRTPSL